MTSRNFSIKPLLFLLSTYFAIAINFVSTTLTCAFETKRKMELDQYTVVKKTVYAEARGEPEEGQQWVVWVIKNRASRPRDYWGGPDLKSVCLARDQFECWNNGDFPIGDQRAYDRIDSWLPSVIEAPMSQDPTRPPGENTGCDHYNNPDKERADWANRVRKIRKINNHQFYKE